MGGGLGVGPDVQTRLGLKLNMDGENVAAILRTRTGRERVSVVPPDKSKLDRTAQNGTLDDMASLLPVSARRRSGQRGMLMQRTFRRTVARL